MSGNKFADASYAVQSQWLLTECSNAPDLIIGTQDVFGTVPFSSLVISGPGYCGNEWIEDCSYPGICAASLDLSMTFGYKSFQDSYFYTVPQSPSDWLFPAGAKGNTYCQISNANETDLILAGSSVCYNNFKCSSANEILYYTSSTCDGSYLAYPSNTLGVSVQIAQVDYALSVFTVTRAAETVSWTTYITPYETTLQGGETLWILAVCIIIFAILLNVIHLALSVKKAYLHHHAKRIKYCAYVVGYIFNILECIFVFFTFAQGTVSGTYVDLLFGLDSGFNVALNGICLMEIVFQKPWQRGIICLGLIAMYVLFAFPYVFNFVFSQDWVSDFGIWLNVYFNTISYPVWQIFCFAFDPITAGIIILYIIRSSLHELNDELSTLLFIMFNDAQLIGLAAISFLNFSFSVFLQLATTYTLFARNDKVMSIYQIIFSLQHSINSCCTLWYCSYFPQVLTRMKALKKTVKSKKSVKSGIEKRSHTVKSEPQKESQVQSL
ncbi:hypothetical protein HDV01_003919 [Terramyces sp. JEL0728]|nr:hypothetical protein HDV01_003919 [Terramyces sp. JEL0728]